MANVIRTRVKQGTLLGKIIKYSTETPICAYRGVPYAKPPVGELRFQPPRPLSRFSSDPLECFANGPSPIQRPRPDRTLSEDCLHLNIYTPTKTHPGTDSTKPWPVMVVFFGGGFRLGDNTDTYLSPEYLVERGLVLVTVNYRLGALGWLHYPEGGISGNQGLKDQQLALRWVAENVEQFGGDPNNVTIAGASAGGFSCHLHLLNPESKRYFHKVIAHSLCALTDILYPTRMQEKVLKIATDMTKRPAAEFKDPREVVATLMSADAQVLHKHADNNLIFPREKYNRFPCPWGVVIEEPSPTAFLTQSPLQLMRELPNHTHPMLLGMQSREGGESLVQLVSEKLEARFKEDAHYTPFCYADDDPRLGDIQREIKEFYYGASEYSRTNVGPALAFIRDKIYTHRVRQAMDLHVELKYRAPLYVYEFAYDGAFESFTSLSAAGYPGPVHGDEHGYLGDSDQIYRGKERTPEELEEAMQMRRTMCELWVNFAKNGKPTLDGDRHFEWDPVLKEDGRMMQIQGPNKFVSYVDRDLDRRYQFWRSLMMRYSPGVGPCKL